jgi:uncharacterized protein YndB with AHSA1/START domain
LVAGLLTIYGNRLVANQETRQPGYGRKGTSVDEAITREIFVDAAPHLVWDALTDPGELAAWFGADAEVDLRLGGAVRFRWSDGSERRGLLVDLAPPRRLAFRWREMRSPTAGSGLTVAEPTVVAFSLSTEGRGTLVRVTETPGLLDAEPPLALAESV